MTLTKNMAGESAASEIGLLAGESPALSARGKRLADVPTQYRGLYRRAWAAKSRKAAIRAFCLECVCWQPSEVHRCTAPACPLYEYRLHG